MRGSLSYSGVKESREGRLADLVAINIFSEVEMSRLGDVHVPAAPPATRESALLLFSLPPASQHCDR
jgi:hypothetical protein